MHALTLVQLEKLAEHYTNTLELVYINSFNCLCFFLLADLIQASGDGSGGGHKREYASANFVHSHELRI